MELSKGKRCLFDVEDLPIVENYVWYLTTVNKSNYK